MNIKQKNFQIFFCFKMVLQLHFLSVLSVVGVFQGHFVHAVCFFIIKRRINVPASFRWQKYLEIIRILMHIKKQTALVSFIKTDAPNHI